MSDELVATIAPGATTPATATVPVAAESSKPIWSPVKKFVAVVPDEASTQLKEPPTSTAEPVSQVVEPLPFQRRVSTPVMSRSIVVAAVS